LVITWAKLGKVTTGSSTISKLISRLRTTNALTTTHIYNNTTKTTKGYISMQRMFKQHFRASQLALAVTAALSMATMAQAQQAGSQVEEIAVTGTRIRSTDGMVTPTPVTSVTV
jgi:hypothetical protein